jgi:DNA invertase Pin-like site-specific DNA recombinase
VPKRCGVSWSDTLVKITDKPIAATYSRVSNPNDARDASLDTQEDAQVALWERLGFQVPSECRLRERYTGMESIYDRPVLNHLRDLVASGRIQGMSAYDTDRLARDPNELLTVVRDNLKHKVETKFVQCDHATEGRIGEMILYMKGFASALEYDAIRDRTMRGVQRILSLGQWVGGGKPKYGLIFIKDERGRQRVANPETAPNVRRMFDLALSGHTVIQIAEIFNRERIPSPYAYAGHARAAKRWSPEAVARIIRDRTYIGEAAARTTIRVEGRHKSGKPRRKRRPPHEHLHQWDSRTEPLVSPEVFERANLILDARRTRQGRNSGKEEYLLRGRVFCGLCDERLTPQTKCSKDHRTRKPYTYRTYRCITYRRKPESTCKAICGAIWVERIGWDLLRKYLLAPGRLEHLITQEIARLESEDGVARIEADLKRTEERRKKIDQMMSRAIDAKLDSNNHVNMRLYDEKLESLSREASELDKHIAGLHHQIDVRGARRKIVGGTLEIIGEIRQRLRHGDPDDSEKRQIIEMLDARFYAWRDGPDLAGDRHVRAELPLGLHGATLGDSPAETATT